VRTANAVKDVYSVKGLYCLMQTRADCAPVARPAGLMAKDLNSLVEKYKTSVLTLQGKNSRSPVFDDNQAMTSSKED
jgi:hypothetical protein